MKITVSRAMTEIKTLQKRYNKVLAELNVIAVQKGEKLSGDNISIQPNDFSEAAKSSYQSAIDLMNRIVVIKKAIVSSNQSTTVVIAGKTMTVQEAIIEKNYIDNKKNLLSRLKDLYLGAKSHYECENKQNENIIEGIVNATTEKNSKSIIEARQKAEDMINSTKKLSFVDPIKVQEKIKKLEQEIEDFESNVDYSLSESNSTTMIEVPD